MSETPPPEGAAASDSSSAAGDDWRKAVPQSFRSNEVRSVAKVLASLEPGATASSKLMLAMKFEDSIFQSSSSLDDYRKRLTKRLRKAQKSYKPPPEGPAGDVSPASAGSSVHPGGAAHVSSSASSASSASVVPQSLEAEQRLERELRSKYGAALLFIVENATDAVEVMREKHGQAKAESLRQHTDNAKQWAVEIGLKIAGNEYVRRVPREAGYLDRVRLHLEQRVENIRSHVVKLTAPDLFLQETLEKVEDAQMLSIVPPSDDAARDTAAYLPNPAADELGRGTREMVSRLGQTVPASDVAEMRRLLEQAAAPIPPPRRGVDSEVYDRIEALAHVDKIRTASQLILSYMALDGKSKAELRGCVKRTYALAVQSLTSVLSKDQFFDTGAQKRSPTPNASTRRQYNVTLEDAWNREMQYDAGGGPTDASSADAPAEQGPIPSSAAHVVIRSRALFVPARRASPPIQLLPALRRKGAEIQVNGERHMGTQLRLDFGDAFVMTIHFVPLLVTIRAKLLDANSSTGVSATGAKRKAQSLSSLRRQRLRQVSMFRQTVVDGGLPRWRSARSGLWNSAPISEMPFGTGSRASSGAQPPRRRRRLTVLGVSADAPLEDDEDDPYAYRGDNPLPQLDVVAAKKLEYASARATHVLRRCFADVGAKVYAKTDPPASAFELEIAEGTALLQFLQLARSTFIDGWQDLDV